ncbi:MAG: hypothetical protein ACI4KI_01035 [Candidatus Fimenecus sp.]
MKNTVKKVVALAMVVISLLTLCSCSLGKGKDGEGAKDFKSNIKVSFAKVNGYGEATIENADTFLDDVVSNDKVADFKKKQIEKNGVNAGYALDGVETASDCFELFLKEENRYLSNGDSVVVMVKASEPLRVLGFSSTEAAKELGLKLDSEELTYTVEGLQEPREIDIFENIEKYIQYGYGNKVIINLPYPINFSGASDVFGYAEYDRWSGNCDIIVFKDSNKTDSNGNNIDIGCRVYFSEDEYVDGESYKITANVYDDDETLLRAGYKIARTEIELIAPTQIEANSLSKEEKIQLIDETLQIMESKGVLNNSEYEITEKGVYDNSQLYCITKNIGKDKYQKFEITVGRDNNGKAVVMRIIGDNSYWEEYPITEGSLYYDDYVKL